MVNCGIGDAAQNNKGLDAAINDMALITGQRPVKTKAKNAIATFKIRENQTLGIAVTLRGNVSFFLPPSVFKFLSGKVFKGKKEIRNHVQIYIFFFWKIFR